MDESSRRAVLGGVGAGLAGLLAGCAGRAPRIGTGEPTPSQPPGTAPPTSTPERESAEHPAFWDWLPQPDAVGSDYSFGSLAVPAIRSAGLDRDLLAPTRFTPEGVHDVLDATTDLLTLSTGSSAGGILRGDYDTDALAETLETGGLSADGDGVYTGDRLGFQLGSALVRWADHPTDPATVLTALGNRIEGGGESYPATAPPVERVLGAIEGPSARFGRPIDVDDGPFATARFLANGIGAADGSIRWVSALAFEGDVSDAAAVEYRGQFVDRDGFENVVARTEPGLLVIESETTAERAAATQPL